MLVLEYKKEHAGSAPALVSVGIAADYDYIETAESLTIYDYELRRRFTVSGLDSFINDSLYAEIWRRMDQLRTRVVRARLTGARDAQDESESDVFWAETESGLALADVPADKPMQVVHDTEVQWYWHGVPVAIVHYQREPVPPSIKKSLRRFWPMFARMHPAIAEALAASGRMPAELWVKQTPSERDGSLSAPRNGASQHGSNTIASPQQEVATKRDDMVHWMLKSSRWEPSARYPLPPHRHAVPTTTTGLFPQTFATLSAFVSERAAPPSAETYKLRAQAAISHRRGLEALLWFMEMELAHGPLLRCSMAKPSPYCAPWSEATHLAAIDPRTSLAFDERAPDATERYRFNDLPNSYLLQLRWATESRLIAPLKQNAQLGRAIDEIGLLAALRASPVANFCKDAGIFYASEQEPFAAWQAWDFGRQMVNHQPGDMLESISTLEGELEKREPEFF